MLQAMKVTQGQCPEVEAGEYMAHVTWCDNGYRALTHPFHLEKLHMTQPQQAGDVY